MRKKMIIVAAMLLSLTANEQTVWANKVQNKFLAQINEKVNTLENLVDKIQDGLNSYAARRVQGAKRPIYYAQIKIGTIKKCVLELVQLLYQKDAMQKLQQIKSLALKIYSLTKDGLIKDNYHYLNAGGVLKAAEQVGPLAQEIERMQPDSGSREGEVEEPVDTAVSSTTTTPTTEKKVAENSDAMTQPNLASLPHKPTVTEDRITVERAAQILGVNPAELEKQFVDADFYIYTNRVGDYKSTILVKTKDNEAFVLKLVKPNYPKAYLAIQEKQKRPYARFFTIQSSIRPDATGHIIAVDYNVPVADNLTMGVFDFMGSTRFNPFNDRQIQQLAQMGISFAMDNDIFDHNPGNIVVKDGKLYYIDVGLAYSPEPTKCLNLLKNIEVSLVFAHDCLKAGYTETDLNKVYDNILSAYKKEIIKLDPKTRTILKNDYKKSVDFYDEWNNHITFKGELSSVARWLSSSFFEKSDDFEVHIIKDIGEIFDLINQ